MKRLLFFIFAVLGFTSGLSAQNNQVLFTIDNSPVTVDEFKSIYLKNTANTPTRESVVDYLELYINFKLKVHEAKQLQIDTVSSFKSEYEGYVKQLAQPYLTDVEVNQNLIDEAYTRMTKELNASHILINVPSETDTLKYYQRAMAVRDRILAGEPFEKVAVETSNDPSVSRNSGSLGYFSAFQMVYPFETAAYNTPVGQVSMPVRTQFGYHIIKVNDIRPSQGKVKIAHIMIKTPRNNDPQAIETARKTIVDIHTRLTNGEDFATIAKAESQDAGTAPNGGEFPWLASGQVIPEIERVAFALPTNGSISQPFQTPFGWHVLKRIDRKMVGTKEELLPEIKTRIARDSRSFKSIESFVSKLKAEYAFKEDLSTLQLLNVDSAIYANKWKAPELTTDPVIFTLDEKNYNLSAFATFLQNNQRMTKKIPVNTFVNNTYNDWVKNMIVAYEETQLSKKYPDFRQLQQEYYEGMLLFEISERQVWAMSTDSARLASYYATNSEKYKWGKRVHYVIYTLASQDKTEAFTKIITSKKSAKLNPADIVASATKKLKVEVQQIQKSANADDEEIVGFEKWTNGIKTQPIEEGKERVIKILNTTSGDVKKLAECRGELTADLQVEMEKQWISNLKQKHSVVVNNEVLDALKNELK